MAAAAAEPPFALSDEHFLVNDEPVPQALCHLLFSLVVTTVPFGVGLCVQGTLKLTRYALSFDGKSGSHSVSISSCVGLSVDAASNSLKLHAYPYPDPGCCGADTERVYKPVYTHSTAFYAFRLVPLLTPVLCCAVLCCCVCVQWTLVHSNPQTLQSFAAALQRLICGVSPHASGPLPAPRRMLVLVNPFGGRGVAARVCSAVEPVLRHTGAAITRRETQRAGHAFDIGKELKLGEFDTVCDCPAPSLSRLLMSLCGAVVR